MNTLQDLHLLRYCCFVVVVVVQSQSATYRLYLQLDTTDTDGLSLYFFESFSNRRFSDFYNCMCDSTTSCIVAYDTSIIPNYAVRSSIPVIENVTEPLSSNYECINNINGSDSTLCCRHLTQSENTCDRYDTCQSIGVRDTLGLSCKSGSFGLVALEKQNIKIVTPFPEDVWIQNCSTSCTSTITKSTEITTESTPTTSKPSSQPTPPSEPKSPDVSTDPPSSPTPTNGSMSDNQGTDDGDNDFKDNLVIINSVAVGFLVIIVVVAAVCYYRRTKNDMAASKSNDASITHTATTLQTTNNSSSTNSSNNDTDDIRISCNSTQDSEYTYIDDASIKDYASKYSGLEHGYKNEHTIEMEHTYKSLETPEEASKRLE